MYRKKNKKKIIKKSKKKVLKIRFKIPKGIKINKQLKQLKNFNLQLKRKKNRIINKQIERIKGLSLKKPASFISKSLNKVYEDFKKKQKIRKIKQIKLKERKKAKHEFNSFALIISKFDLILALPIL